MSTFFRCPHCNGKIPDTTTGLIWLQECDICGKEFPNNFTREAGGMSVRTRGRMADPVVQYDHVCEECQEAADAAIKDVITNLAEKRKVLA